MISLPSPLSPFLSLSLSLPLSLPSFPPLSPGSLEVPISISRGFKTQPEEVCPQDHGEQDSRNYRMSRPDG